MNAARARPGPVATVLFLALGLLSARADERSLVERLAAASDADRSAARGELATALLDPRSAGDLIDAASRATPEVRLALRAAAVACPASAAALYRVAGADPRPAVASGAAAMLEELLLAEIGRRADLASARPEPSESAWFEHGTLTGLATPLGAPVPLWAAIDWLSLAAPGRRPLAFEPALGAKIDAPVAPNELAAGTAGSIVETILGTRGLVVVDLGLIGLIVAAPDATPTGGEVTARDELAAVRRLVRGLTGPEGRAPDRDLLFRALHVPGAADAAWAAGDAGIGCDAIPPDADPAVLARCVRAARGPRERAAWVTEIARDARRAALTGTELSIADEVESRAAAAWLIGESGRSASEAPAILAPLLVDPHHAVREAAICAAARIDPTGAAFRTRFAALSTSVGPAALRDLIEAGVAARRAGAPIDAAPFLASADHAARALGAALIAAGDDPFDPRVVRIAGAAAIAAFSALAPPDVMRVADRSALFGLAESPAPAALACGFVRCQPGLAEAVFEIARSRVSRADGWHSAAQVAAIEEIAVDGHVSRAGPLAVWLARADDPVLQAAGRAWKGMLREDRLGARFRPLSPREFPACVIPCADRGSVGESEGR